MSSWPSTRRKWVPSCRTRSYSASVNERRSKQPLVEHSQRNSTGASPPRLLARPLMFSFSTLNSDSFLARRSWRSSSIRTAYGNRQALPRKQVPSARSATERPLPRERSEQLGAPARLKPRRNRAPSSRSVPFAVEAPSGFEPLFGESGHDERSCSE